MGNIDLTLSNLKGGFRVSEYLKEKGEADISKIEDLISYTQELETTLQSEWGKLDTKSGTFIYKKSSKNLAFKALRENYDDVCHELDELNERVGTLVDSAYFCPKGRTISDLELGIDMLRDEMDGIISYNKRILTRNNSLHAFIDTFWYKCYKFFKKEEK